MTRQLRRQFLVACLDNMTSRVQPFSLMIRVKPCPPLHQGGCVPAERATTFLTLCQSPVSEPRTVVLVVVHDDGARALVLFHVAGNHRNSRLHLPRRGLQDRRLEPRLVTSRDEVTQAINTAPKIFRALCARWLA